MLIVIFRGIGWTQWADNSLTLIPFGSWRARETDGSLSRVVTRAAFLPAVQAALMKHHETEAGCLPRWQVQFLGRWASIKVKSLPEPAKDVSFKVINLLECHILRWHSLDLLNSIYAYYTDMWNWPQKSNQCVFPHFSPGIMLALWQRHTYV